MRVDELGIKSCDASADRHDLLVVQLHLYDGFAFDRMRALSAVQVDLSAAPPFTLADLKNAIPSELFKRKAGHSMRFLFRDVGVVLGLAAAAQAVNAWCAPADLCGKGLLLALLQVCKYVCDRWKHDGVSLILRPLSLCTRIAFERTT